MREDSDYAGCLGEPFVCISKRPGPRSVQLGRHEERPDSRGSSPSFSGHTVLTAQAESVSHHLKCPVLLHGRPKPGCSQEILAYFSGTLGAPRTLRKEVLAQTAAESKEEEEDEAFFLQKWKDRVRGPLLGPLLDQAGQPVKPEQDPARDVKPVPKNPAQAMDEFPDKKGKKEDVFKAGVDATPTAEEAIRVVVIGDRLFTDTLLANQLRAQLANTPAPQASSAGPTSQERVVSIHTTLLPQPNDVRALRWLEHRLTRGRLRQSAVDWGRFVVDPNARDGSISPVPAPGAPKGWARLVPPLIRDAPPLTRDPRSWKPVPVLLGLGRGLVFLARWSGRQAVRGVKWAWARAKRRSELAKESLETQSPAEKTLEKVAA